MLQLIYIFDFLDCFDLLILKINFKKYKIYIILIYFQTKKTHLAQYLTLPNWFYKENMVVLAPPPLLLCLILLLPFLLIFWNQFIN